MKIKMKMKMKISHVISSIDKNSGGTSVYLKFLLEALDLYTIQNLITFDSINNIEIKADLKWFLIKKSIYNVFFSKSMVFNLKNSDTDLFHGNGLWEYPVHLMAQSALKNNTPYIISTHGMLEPWSLTQSKLKKKVAMLLFQHKDLKKAACIHATGVMEVESIRRLGYTNPIANIPNGINIKDFPQKQCKLDKTKKTILFLSRIHPKKGIEILISAWQSLDDKVKENWNIKIAGNGDDSYISQLNSLIQQKGLDDSITIIGSKFGHDKIATYHEADLFVLPTHSENFGIVIAEALCCGIPVITTTGTPWDVLERCNAGKWISVGENPLKVALESLMSKTDEEREAMGNNGRKLIEEKFSIESVAQRFVLLYQWILTGENKPDFIYE